MLRSEPGAEWCPLHGSCYHISPWTQPQLWLDTGAAQKTARRREPLEPRSASSWRGCHIERKAQALLPINGGIFSGIDTAGVRGPDGGVGQSCRMS